MQDDIEMNGNGEGGDPMHELLCRVVFGEADEAERAELERALEASAELREQKAELEATASLVRGAMGADSVDGPAMSEARVESILAAATTAAVPAPAPRRWRPVLRAAAVVLVLGGGYWMVQQGSDRVASETGLDLAAGDSLSPEAQSAPDPSPERSREMLLGVGYGGGAAGATIGPTEVPAVNASSAPPSASDEALAGLGHADEEAPESIAFGGQALLSGGQPAARPVHAARGGSLPGLKVVDLDGLGQATRRGAGGGGGAFSEGKLRDSGDRDPASASALVGEAATGSHSSNVITRLSAGSDEEFLGLGQADGPYRGPGDVVPPGGGAPSPASPGPSFVAPAGAPGTAPAGPKLQGSMAARRLEAIGYTGGSTGSEHEVRPRRSLERSRAPRRGRPASERYQRHAPSPLPGERPRDMFFRFWGDNPFVITDVDRLSTFAADVDTASFALAKRMLNQGLLPQRAQIRTEEFVNFLEPDLAAPKDDTFAIHAELAPSPFGGPGNRQLLRVGLRAMEIDEKERPGLALTFVVDTSGSMSQNNRLELVKHAMRLLVDKLDERDTIAIVRFSNDASIVLPATSAMDRTAIETALFGLGPDGGTNAEAGLKLGYQLGESSMRDGAQSRVVFLSDGVANVGQTDQERIAADVSASAARGVFLNTIGVGLGNHNDTFLEQLAGKGQGVCDYVGDAEDARRAIVERFVGGFVTVAKDVKIQVEFDPKSVLRWRQLGYENRAVADADFRRDSVDAGEVGAGHQVTCLYELEVAANSEGPMATARVRWKPVTTGAAPVEQQATERSRSFRRAEVARATFRGASHGFRRAALSAQFAEALRDSIHTAGDSVEGLGQELAGLLAADRHADTATVAEMCRQALGLGLVGRPAPVQGDAEQKHRDAYYDELIRSLGGHPAEVSRTASRESAEVESRIRSLIEGNPGRKPQ